ncbi:Gfo/Idh/MocA family protein [Actibacterium lipolyticum]|uniref:4-carboxy-2-hydroxymuconate-6-semialdehyde dehydrogenase n=1 Tax=Actibacterium lipolyticum TaxID=1524263 RepID=A0A238KPF9_9RHOB|nr:Gfo/Idh/MocA family oxidoreductase [Actibacterium lipolyticum]SMX44685.1 4-carboxy-2-hydroxymuconate-6-semialdehyde dehydrogenase [Actibacterium lipolyticum]
MTSPIRIAVAGAGLIGKRHIEAIDAVSEATLACIVDPSDAGRAVASARGTAWFASLSEMLDAKVADGVVLATPNQVHVDNGLECVAAGIPALVEKPLATDVAQAERLVDAAKAAGVPLLVGHHRRHNPLIQTARAAIDEGKLGTITAVHGQCWFFKPDDYFNVDWRRAKGAGPVFLNMIHDLDLLRYLCGEVTSVQALESNAIRGNEVEETAAVLLKFANGALGTMTVSDTIVAPWSWELTARENPAYPAHNESCYMIGGTRGSISLPNLTIWQNQGSRGWHEPLSATKTPFGFEDPLIRQIRQFAAVIRGEEEPLVSGEEGLKTLRLIEAVKQSAATEQTVMLD